MKELTLCVIKPGAWRRSMTGLVLNYIVQQPEFSIVATKRERMSETVARAFYQEHHGKNFFNALVEHAVSGPSVFVAIRGEGAIQYWRDIIGPTDPWGVDPFNKYTGLRGIVCGEHLPDNGLHGSATQEAADYEIGLVFGIDTALQLIVDR